MRPRKKPHTLAHVLRTWGYVYGLLLVVSGTSSRGLSETHVILRRVTRPSMYPYYNRGYRDCKVFLASKGIFWRFVGPPVAVEAPACSIRPAVTAKFPVKPPYNRRSASSTPSTLQWNPPCPNPSSTLPISPAGPTPTTSGRAGGPSRSPVRFRSQSIRHGTGSTKRSETAIVGTVDHRQDARLDGFR